MSVRLSAQFVKLKQFPHFYFDTLSFLTFSIARLTASHLFTRFFTLAQLYANMSVSTCLLRKYLVACEKNDDVATQRLLRRCRRLRPAIVSFLKCRSLIGK